MTLPVRMLYIWIIVGCVFSIGSVYTYQRRHQASCKQFPGIYFPDFPGIWEPSRIWNLYSAPADTAREGISTRFKRPQARPDDIKPGQTSRWVIRYRTHGSKLPDLSRDSLSRWQGLAIPTRASHSMTEGIGSVLLLARHQDASNESRRLTLTRQIFVGGCA